MLAVAIGFGLVGAAIGGETGVLGAAGTATAFAVVAAGAVVDGATPANHCLTPLWPAHAPFLVALDVYEPSLQRPVDPEGAAAGTSASTAVDAKRPTIMILATRETFI